ncbi:hypothetical protein [Roseivivax isoporae]|uniref:Seryl-tRNA synthetase n=1 Tax=Roseivivax isoporae LMG 25204 TaxID=1449351 RepID=X7F7H0_9RHOB|nr:hypothetical protein [Roseivivax isoporae]ETX28765.1 seryl-tRNA synthetase [Roseivivax isoporae LMG 25204]
MQRMRALLVLVSALVFALSPLFNQGFNGFDPGQFPVPQDDPAVQPAGYAFAIWGLIYVWLIAGTAFGLLMRATDEDWDPARPWLFLSLALGSIWLPVAQTSVPAATLLIWGMLMTALAALWRIGDTDRWWQLSPVAIYAGWLTAAACVSVGLMLGGYGVMSETPAALAALALAVAIALTVQYRLHRAPEYGITVIWALVAVIVANAAPFNAAVAGLAALGIVAVLALRGTDTE